MTNEQREKIYQWVMASGLQDALFYKAEDTEGKEVVMDRFENFEAFAWHVEQEEREACAKIAETPVGEYEVVVACGTEPAPYLIPRYLNWQDIVKAIRARGDNK